MSAPALLDDHHDCKSCAFLSWVFRVITSSLQRIDTVPHAAHILALKISSTFTTLVSNLGSSFPLMDTKAPTLAIGRGGCGGPDVDVVEATLTVQSMTPIPSSTE